MTTRTLLGAALAVSSLFAVSAANAGGPWTVRVGVHNVDPKSDSGLEVGGAELSVDSAAQLSLNLDYAFTPNLVLDVLGAIPFKHDIELGGDKIASTKHLPPTVTLQYHFLPGTGIDPYVGAGFNYTIFFDEKIDGGADLDLDDSFGLAAQIGVDFALVRDWVLGIDVRYIDIDTDASLDGAKLGTVEIAPLVYGVNLGYRF